MRLLLLAALAAAPLCAQLHFGVKGGIPLNDAIDAAENYRSDFKRFTIGPVAEFSFPLGIELEADLLYKRPGYNDGLNNVGGRSWELPLLLKYKAGAGFLRPFLGAGPNFRWLGGDGFFRTTESSKGIALTGGIALQGGLGRLSAEIRYTHWNNQGFTAGNVARSVMSFSKNQAEFLLGLTF
jgi:hypothetical protein